MNGKLYVVGTPIGNMGDMSPRAVEVLSGVDFIAAEDTRVSLKLLNRFGIQKPLVSYFEHNKSIKTEKLLARLQNGENCAIVTDAGMPAISDPGEELVRACRENGIEVESVPGPSAVITALAASGLATGRFCFEGFLSVNKSSRAAHLAELKDERRTMVFYEAPHKLLATLGDMYKVFGDRKTAFCRELTKLHEQVLIMPLSQAVAYYAENPPKGEFVLVIEGKSEEESEQFSLRDAAKLARRLADEGSSLSAAAKEAASVSGFKKGDIYRILIEREDENG